MKGFRILSILGCILLAFVLTSAVLAGAQGSPPLDSSYLRGASGSIPRPVSPPDEPQTPVEPSNFGGPDLFGYSFIDSREADGPVYAWEEISGTGTLVTSWTSFADGYAGPLPVGFGFPFYENLYHEFYISSHGYLSFGQGQTEVPYMIPSTSPPNNIIVPLRDDLELYNYGTDTRIYMQTLSNPTRLVVEFLDIQTQYGIYIFDYEIILFTNGDIVFQYLSLGGYNGETGIENQDGTDGLPYFYGMADQIAVLFRFPPKQIEFTPSQQTKFSVPGEQVTFTVELRSYLTQTQPLQLYLLPGSLWTTSLSLSSTPPLAYGEDYSFTVQVDIPLAALPGDFDQAVIKVTSTISPGILSTTTLKTGVPSGENAYLPLDPINEPPYLVVWDTQLDVLIDTIDLGPSGCVNPDHAAIPPQGGSVWISCQDSGSLVVVDTDILQITGILSGLNFPTQIAFTQNGLNALVGSLFSEYVIVVDTTHFTVVNQISINPYMDAETIIMHPYLPRAYVAGTSNHSIYLLDTKDMTVTGSFNGWDRTRYATIAHDGRRLYTSHTYRDSVSAIDLLEQRVVDNAYGFRYSDDLAVTHDGGKLYVSDDYDPILTAVDTANMQAMHSFQLPANRWGGALDLTCDGSKLYFLGTTSGATSEQLLMIIDTASDVVLEYAVAPDLDGDGISDGNYTDVAACPQYVAHGAAFWPPSQSASAGRGQSVTYQQALVNAAGITETFSLALGAHNWQSSLSEDDLGPLGPNQMITFTVQVTVPQDADWFATDVLPVNASGMGSGVTGTLFLTTTAYAPPQVSADPQAFTATLYAHDSLTRSLSLANGAGVTLTYTTETADGFGEIYSELLPAGRYYTTTSDNANTFGDDVPDDDLDHYVCYGDYNAPVDFNIWITGSVPGVSETLGLYVFDNQLGEQNQVWLNGVNLGVLDRADAVWHETVFTLPPGLAQPGKNLVQIYPDVHSTYYSCVWLDWGRIFVQSPPVDWITTIPAGGSIPTSSSQEVTLTLDAASLQPGGHAAYLLVHNNDPLQMWLHFPVSLTVLPAPQMGWVAGTVSDVQTGLPLAGTLRALGQPYLVATDPQTGAYLLWLDQGSYTLEASASGYLTQTVQVDITAGLGVSQDFQLVRNAPVISVAPLAISQSVLLGHSYTQVLNLSNLGPQPLTFSIGEYPPGFSTAPRILAWTAYIGGGVEYQHALAALNATTTYSLQETTTEDPGELASLLAQADVFLLPDQPQRTYNYLYNLGVTWASTLQQFVSHGGVVILLGAEDRSSGIPNGAGLTSITWSSPFGWTYTLEVRNPSHPLAAGLPITFTGETNTGYFTWDEDHAVVGIPFQYPTQMVVGAAQFGSGRVVQMAFDFQTYNPEMARLLANAVNWLPILDAPWLSAAPLSGTLPAYTSLPVQVHLTALGVQPGDYIASLGVHSNDPQTPLVVLPVTMTVPTSPDLGRLAGAVSDLWSGDPLTATVGVGGLFTTTASPDFNIWAPAGAYSLTASAPGYLTQTLTVSVLPGAVTQQDFLLEPLQPYLGYLPTSIEMTLTQGTAGLHTLALSDLGPLDLNFSILEISPNLGKTVDAPQDLSGVRILFDRYHSDDHYPQDSALLSNLRAAGAVVDENLSSPLDAALLSSYEILRVGWTSEYFLWSQNELDAVSAWIAQGHGLFIDGASPWIISFDLPDFFGFDAVQSCSLCGSEITTDIQPHPVTQGVGNFLIYIDMNKIYLTHGASAQTLIYDLDTNPQVAVTTLGSGKVVAAGNQNLVDSALFSADNLTFAMNLFEWLAVPGGVDIPWLSTDPVSGTIPARGSLPLDVGFDAAALSPGGYTASLLFETDDPLHASTFVSVTLTVEAPQAGVSLDPASQNGGSTPGSSVIYTFTLTNQGNLPDAFDLSVGSVWSAALSTLTTPVLDPGETQTITLTVQVPTEALAGEQDTALLSAVSQLDPQVSASSQAVTTAQPSAGSVSLTPAVLSGSAASGKTAVYTLTVTNLGAAADSFSLGASGTWTAALSTLTTGSLAPGEHLTFTLSVQVPAGAAEGDQDLTLVTAASESHAGVTAEAQVTTTARMPRIQLPVVLR